MLKLFFNKSQIITNFIEGESYFKASNNLDSHPYAIQKIPIKTFKAQTHYIDRHYYSQHNQNVITYYNCWVEKEQIHQKEKEKQKPVKKQKKKMMQLLKKKSKFQNQLISAPSKHIIQEEEIVYQDFLFVQLQTFCEIQLPKDFNNLKQFIIIIYLLAKKVQKTTGYLPCMIPVWGNDSIKKYKFVKKGKNMNLQLCNLMEFSFKQKQEQYLKQWSQNMWKSIMKAKINKDAELVGQIIKKQIQGFLSLPQQIYIKLQNTAAELQEQCYIGEYQIIKLQSSNVEIPIYEYDLQYLQKNELNRQITLVHNIYESYVLSGRRDWFIIKWLKNMSN